jgi:ribosomal protein S21
LKGLSVNVDDYKSFDAAMNKWSRKVQEDGKMDVVRDRQYFTKPTVARRRKRQLAKLKEYYRNLNADNNRPFG